jgi:hypothetical protein
VDGPVLAATFADIEVGGCGAGARLAGIGLGLRTALAGLGLGGTLSLADLGAGRLGLLVGPVGLPGEAVGLGRTGQGEGSEEHCDYETCGRSKTKTHQV